MRRLRPKTLLLLLLWSLPVVILLALSLGAVDFAISSIFASLWGDTNKLPEHLSTIIWDIRLPRTLLAVLVGAILSLSGAAMQGLFRNPLADPSLIGVTAGASLGASVAIVFFSGSLSHYLGLSVISIGAFLGGSIAVWWVYRLAHSVYGTSVATMLLAGIAITALAGSVNGFLAFYADNELLRRISLWQMGGLEGAKMPHVFLAFTVLSILLLVFYRLAYAFNTLLLGESEARYLGVNTEQLKNLSIFLVAAAVGIAVALAGTIAFVGLVVPHIVRLLIGPDHKTLFVASALGGGILLCLADIFARTLIAPTELPIGLLTALIGVPFFIALLKQRVYF